MGEIIKTLAIKVPTKVVYDFLKESGSSSWIQKYGPDLTKGLATEYSVVSDIPEKEISFKAGKWGTKEELKYSLRNINGKTTEITCHMKYRLTLAASGRASMLYIIQTLLALEKGYTAK